MVTILAPEEQILEEAEVGADSEADADAEVETGAEAGEADKDEVDAEVVAETAEPTPVEAAAKEKVASLGLGDVVIPPLDAAQKELLDTPVDAIPEEDLFIPVPLVARLAASNVTSIQDLALR